VRELVELGTVVVNGQVKYQGSTSEISHKAEAVFAWLGFIAPLKSGFVMGFGTISDCTGCDHEDFIDPGAEIEISIERLGALRCCFAELANRQAAAKPLAAAQAKKHHA
jgi:2-keto-4-pentenoate hydratase/2-oxohepta-3-ene-1,7-dioic acid hydratase in catechol pathway